MQTHGRLTFLTLLLAAQIAAVAACRSERSGSERRAAMTKEPPASLSLRTYNVLADPDPDDARMPALLKIRARQLDAIFALVDRTAGAVVLGDFNFGDGEQPETGRLDRRYTDRWQALRPQEPGYTWDMERSSMARRGSFIGEKSRRLDRILLRARGYRPSSVRIIGKEPVRTGGEIFPSDHFGLLGTIARR